LFSDHGSRRVRGDFLLHQWLLDNDYQTLTKRSPAEQAAALHTVLVRWSSEQNWPPGILEKSGRRLLQGGLNLLPGLLTDNLWRNVETALPFARQYVEQGEELDYRRTRLFPGSTYSGNLYINLTGREPDGVVRPELRAALQAELVQKLARITIPGEGQPLFSGIHTSDQLYQGPAAAYAPDLILDGYDSPWNAKMVSPGLISSTLKEHYFLEQHGDAGWHSKEGIFVFSGPSFRPGSAAEARPAAESRRVMDLPATLLYLYDVPIPEDFDGAVMAGAFTGDFLERRPITFQPGDPETAVPFETAYSHDESAEVMEHLRALGYVE
jgi:predicted AlkP superfamily phosphohydrolase/phosphomutase